MSLSKLKNKIAKFPQRPGVYVFYNAQKEIIYIGKATSLKDRVGSYFRKYDANQQINTNLRIANNTHGRPVEQMIHEVVDINVQETESVLEALILESNLIKKHQPKYNVIGKDDKSFSYFVVTKEEFSRVLIVRKTDLNFKDLEAKSYKLKIIYGPYTSKKQMETALKIMRKIFPIHIRNQKTEKGCLDFQIGLCPGPYAGAISKKDYAKNIRGIRMILEGKKKSLIGKMEKEMELYAKNEEFEKAAEIRNKIFALKHIRDISLVSDENLIPNAYKLEPIRIEAYDISNISGQYAVGSMIVFDNSSGKFESNKNEYRKFKIKTIKSANDVGMMREVLQRRFGNDWSKPDLIFLDGGQGHLNMAENLLKVMESEIPLVAVAKGPTRKISNSKFIISKKFPILKSKFKKELDDILQDRNMIKIITDEAHRFAIGFHRKIRRKNSLK